MSLDGGADTFLGVFSPDAILALPVVIVVVAASTATGMVLAIAGETGLTVLAAVCFEEPPPKNFLKKPVGFSLTGVGTMAGDACPLREGPGSLDFPYPTLGAGAESGSTDAENIDSRACA